MKRFIGKTYLLITLLFVFAGCGGEPDRVSFLSPPGAIVASQPVLFQVSGPRAAMVKAALKVTLPSGRELAITRRNPSAKEYAYIYTLEQTFELGAYKLAVTAGGKTLASHTLQVNLPPALAKDKNLLKSLAAISVVTAKGPRHFNGFLVGKTQMFTFGMLFAGGKAAQVRFSDQKQRKILDGHQDDAYRTVLLRLSPPPRNWFLKLSRDLPPSGSQVCMVGFALKPKGKGFVLAASLGQVIGLKPLGEGQALLQTTNRMWPGAVGSPLIAVDAKGPKVVGMAMITMKGNAGATATLAVPMAKLVEIYGKKIK